MINYNNMLILATSRLNLNDLNHKHEYAKLYLHHKKNQFKLLGLHDKREKLISRETDTLYINEYQLVKEYLEHNATHSYPVYVENLYEVEFSCGVMKKPTIDLLQEWEGLSPDEFDEFCKRLFSRIEAEVDDLYDDIERNLDGKYGVTYEL